MKIVLDDPKLTMQEKKTLIDELRKNNPTSADRWTYRHAIWMLGIIVALCISGLCLPFVAKTPEITQALTAIGSASLGGLAGLLKGGS